MGRNHINILGRMKSASLCAVVDPILMEKGETASIPEGVHVFGSTKEMLTEVQPSVVHVVSPPDTHFPVAMEAVEAGCHVYVEKPFCMNEDEAQQLFDAAEKKQVKLCAGHQLAFHPSAVKLWKKLPSLGKTVHVDSEFLFQPVRRDASGALMNPHDQLVDVLPHPVYLTLHALRESAGSDQRFEINKVLSPNMGEVRVLGTYGRCTATIIVSLTGRPIDTFIRVVGDRGSIQADLVLGSTIGQIAPRKSAVTVLIRPFIAALQQTFGTLGSLAGAAFSKASRTGGLEQLIQAFYASLSERTHLPQDPDEIGETVRLCEEIESEARNQLIVSEELAEARLREIADELPPLPASQQEIAVTGATGFLGRTVVERLRMSGIPVKALVRKLPLASSRIPGIVYVQLDLAEEIPEDVLDGIDAVVHLAAETHGGKDLHARNTVLATQNLMSACAKADIKKFINIGSIGIVRSDAGQPIDESSPVDEATEERGPYVWGKATAEADARRMADQSGIDLITIRPGPLVSFDAFEPPGRLGRSIGSLFLAVGPKSDRLPVCDVSTLANLIVLYVSDFSAGPRLLHALEPGLPTRQQLVDKFVNQYPGTRVLWLPSWLIAGLSRVVSVGMRIFGRQPIDIYSAFKSGNYDTSRLKAFVAER